MKRDWAIELLVSINSQLYSTVEHNSRFNINGSYYNLPFKKCIVIDFRPKDTDDEQSFPKSAERLAGVWIVVYDSKEFKKIWITKYDEEGNRSEDNIEIVLQDSSMVLEEDDV